MLVSRLLMVARYNPLQIEASEPPNIQTSKYKWNPGACKYTLDPGGLQAHYSFGCIVLWKLGIMGKWSVVCLGGLSFSVKCCMKSSKSIISYSEFWWTEVTNASVWLRSVYSNGVRAFEATKQEPLTHSWGLTLAYNSLVATLPNMMYKDEDRRM